MTAVPQQPNGFAAAGEAIALGMVALERIKRQWELAADALPQLICLLDTTGKVIRANRTVERWGIATVSEVRGRTLHDALHGRQCDPQCKLRALLSRRAGEQLSRGRPVKHASWDARLGRHLSILIQPQQPPMGDVFAIASIEDVGDEEAERRRLTARHVSVREEERRRVARDLHDALGQSLNVLKLSIQETARRLEEQGPTRSAEALQQIAAEVQRIMSDVRNIAMDLRPSTLDDLGLIPTLSWFFREVESCRKLAIERSIEVSEADIPQALKLEIYRILQEAISNALRHAGAAAVRVRLHREADELHLCIQDNGRGFNGDARRGNGLFNMKERAESAGGRFAVESAHGKGTRLSASWPLAARMPEPSYASSRVRSALGRAIAARSATSSPSETRSQRASRCTPRAEL